MCASTPEPGMSFMRVFRGTPCWRFEVQDDGKGFDARLADRRRKPTSGCASCRSGAQRIGARVRVDSAPGRWLHGSRSNCPLSNPWKKPSEPRPL